MIGLSGIRLRIIVLTIAFSCLAACGEGKDDGRGSTDNASSGIGGLGAVLLCTTEVLVSGNSQCVNDAMSPRSSSSSDSSGLPATPASNTRYIFNYEYEPNDDWLTANILTLQSSTNNSGFTAEGALTVSSDPADTYSLSRWMTHRFRFSLCPRNDRHCDETGTIDTATAYIDLLDSYGIVIASTKDSDANLMEPVIEADLTYYLQVVAGDASDQTIEYFLTGHQIY